jgi:hypothetical protein
VLFARHFESLELFGFLDHRSLVEVCRVEAALSQKMSARRQRFCSPHLMASLGPKADRQLRAANIQELTFKLEWASSSMIGPNAHYRTLDANRTVERCRRLLTLSEVINIGRFPVLRLNQFAIKNGRRCR